ncbi:MAG: PDZ domain-containing protein [Phycisphaeraceae bacterium]|nr:PDZ domain-containing protein [Phycisphaeraceae bacterium]
MAPNLLTFRSRSPFRSLLISAAVLLALMAGSAVAGSENRQDGQSKSASASNSNDERPAAGDTASSSDASKSAAEAGQTRRPVWLGLRLSPAGGAADRGAYGKYVGRSTAAGQGGEGSSNKTSGEDSENGSAEISGDDSGGDSGRTFGATSGRGSGNTSGGVLEDVPAGFVVMNVAADSPADRAGMRIGDLVLSIGDQDGPKTLEELGQWLAGHHEGQVVEFQVRGPDDSASRSHQITLTGSPPPERIRWKQPTQQRVLGFWRQDEQGHWAFDKSSEVDPAVAQSVNPAQVGPIAPGQVMTQVFVGPDGVISYKFIREEESGRIEVERTSEGRIIVKRSRRTDDDRDVIATQSFEDVKELRGMDPEAAEILDGIGVRAQVTTPGQPDNQARTTADLARLLAHLEQLRTEGRTDPRLRDLIATAVRQIEAQQRAVATGKTLDDVLRENQQLRLRIEELLRQGQSGFQIEQIGDEFIVRLSVDGDVLTRRFSSLDELRERAPRAYERFRALSEAFGEPER